ncbi:MAG: GrpB family protein [Verrucomicrobiota bacterium]|jgi:GrpB-like predicted nucleotidyltransferase (UPF0157 family)
MSITQTQKPAEFRLVVVGAEWAARFAEERARIAKALAGNALEIQHIGSTAIPGITAKPVLDIAAAIHDFESGHALVPALVSLGYTYRGENGIARRHYFERGDLYHLHVFDQGSLDWLRHLRFRGRLLASPGLAARYTQVKLAAARESGGNRARYQDLKASFIEEVQNL